MVEFARITTMTAAVKQLLVEANQSPYIAHISTAAMADFVRQDTIRFLVEDGNPIGFAGWIPINEQWVELGPFFVASTRQGQGLGKRLVREIIDLIGDQHNLYAITFNPGMAALLEKQGMTRTPLSRLSIPVWLHLIRKLRLRHLGQWWSRDDPVNIRHYLKRKGPMTVSIDPVSKG